ncbi:ATP-dependent DNA helicase [Orrella sp. JC864]|uniref:ATP-dependent DNA helicase n=1 Tax=Orrella sp. JC864 TaxID=3120298 RepID=UPI0030095DE4
MSAPAGPGHVVAVRALCEFTARHGDLDTRYTPAPSALEGMAGHGLVRQRRGPGYEAEIALSAYHGGLLVRGRADGYDPGLQRLEEIKTHRGRFEAIGERQRALHWAQARIYGHLFCQARGMGRIGLALVYLETGSQRETVLHESWDAAELAAYFSRQCDAYLAWAAQEAAHRQARDAALRALSFPQPRFRSGQRELCVAVYRSARDGGCLMAQAPTGIGKTLGTLFPVLRACPESGLDKVFFLTAKAPGRALALQALQTLQAHGAAPLRVLELRAREQACEHPGRACHGQDCPLARGFYDRLPAARAQACAGTGHWRQAALREIALGHGICPYYLAQELARWADVVVGDYNYYYDASAMLYALARQQGWRVAVLADEAHNLVERARGMYTARIERQACRRARAAAPPALRACLDTLGRHWNDWLRQIADGPAYRRHDALPQAWLRAPHQAVSAIAEHLADSPAGLPEPVQRFFFDALHFTRLAEQLGPHTLLDTTRTGNERRTDATVCLRNVIPAGFLAPRHAGAWVTVLFSATLAPARYYRDTLGLPPQTGWLEVAAPFRPEQLAVRVVGNVSTRWRDRAGSVPRIAGEIARRYRARPGNYLVFLSSFDYLRQVAGHLGAEHGDWPLWVQTPDMDEAARAGFLARFVPEGRGLGFAVLGGAFSEGVDLPGSRLVGVIVATLGLPQFNAVNEQMRQIMQARFGSGYDYVYLYPGLRKVVQAAGRVIRSETDQGSLTLIDDRYRQPEVRALLPRWWGLHGARPARD